MAYNANQHARFAVRQTNFMRQVWNLYGELQTLREIYDEETASGTHADFTATSEYSKQELIDAITFQESFKALVDGGAAISQTDRRANITPFLASEP